MAKLRKFAEFFWVYFFLIAINLLERECKFALPH
jgi:hypothetical protein